MFNSQLFFKIIYFLFAYGGILLISFLMKKRVKKLKKPLIMVSLLITFVYFGYRLFFTHPTNGVVPLIVFIVFILIELSFFMDKIYFALIFWNKHKVKHVPHTELATLPTVDVLIFTYNEHIDIIKRTTASVLNLDYPRKLLNIYICDDGGRKHIREMARQFGVHYITRPDNTFAKAGNMNNALTKTGSELVLTLDVDMVVKSDFLTRTLGHFKDPKVGFVQAPQTFYNYDPFQYNLYFEENIPNEQDMFMRCVQEQHSQFNAVMHVGTNAVFRRSVLEEIGGVPTISITEDVTISMLIQARGYKSIFVNEVLATGLAAESYHEYIKQRKRWCRGTMQLLKHMNPLKVPGLNTLQRVIYFNGILYWFNCFRILIIFLIPLFFWFFKIPCFDFNIIDYLIFSMPFTLNAEVCYNFFYKNLRNTFWQRVYEIGQAPFMAVAIILELFFKKSTNFAVTSKGKKTEKTVFHRHLALPHLLILLLTLAGIIKYIFSAVHGGSINYSHLILFSSWTLTNITMILVAIFVTFDRKRTRSAERFYNKMDLMFKPGMNNAVKVEMVNISEKGIQIKGRAKDFPSQFQKGIHEIVIPDAGRIKCKLRRLKEDANGRFVAGFSFNRLTIEQYIRLIKLVYDQSVLIKSPGVAKKSGFIFILVKLITTQLSTGKINTLSGRPTTALINKGLKKWSYISRAAIQASRPGRG